MKRIQLLLPLLWLIFMPETQAQTVDNALKSRAELSNYEETTRYDEVQQFIAALQQRSPLVRAETFGKTGEGRAMPLMILSEPAVSQPREARATGKTIVFIMANIHAGEVEGKEAVISLARRLALGDLRPLLKDLVILLAPIYNADGNEKISLNNRTAQNGPIGGVGVRENSKGLDLNRDYMKLDSPEANALVGLFNRWDPHLTVDLHTTNGSYHGYHLTYSQPLHPGADANILSFHRDKMLPALTKAMLKRHKFRTYYYGNFANFSNKLDAKPENRRWEAFTHQPRIGQNYVGLRNRLTILSEAYSYLSFQRRVEVTEAFVEEIFRYAAANAAEIARLTKQADLDATRRETATRGVTFENVPLSKPVEILVGEVVKVKNPRNGKDMTAMVEDKFTPVKMPDYGLFVAKRSIAAPRAYLFAPDLRVAVEKLKAHGVLVEELTAPLTVEVENFTIATVTQSQRPFQGHRETKLTGQYGKENQTFPAGTALVRTAQPLGALAFYLLEAESDDGLVDWNFLDSYLSAGKVYPIYRLTQAANPAARALP